MAEFKTDIHTNKFLYRIEPNPEGGFVAKPAEPELPTIDGATREEVLQKIQSAISERIGHQLPTMFKLGNLNVTVNKKVSVTTHTASNAAAPGDAPITPESQSTLPMDAAPIIPERSSGTALWVIVGLLILGAMMYFSYLHK